MALRQLAVFMNAGSYVIKPKSFALTLIRRRSIARIVPSWIATSYVLPVRLSVIVSVSLIAGCFGLRRVGHRLARNAVRTVGPAGEILELAALAAERTPLRIDWMFAAERTQRRFGHPPIL